MIAPSKAPLRGNVSGYRFGNLSLSFLRPFSGQGNNSVDTECPEAAATQHARGYIPNLRSHPRRFTTRRGNQARKEANRHEGLLDRMPPRTFCNLVGWFMERTPVGLVTGRVVSEMIHYTGMLVLMVYGALP